MFYGWMVVFVLVVFYGISILVGYLMPTVDDNMCSPYRGFSTLAKELKVTSHVMQSSSIELNIR